MSLSAYSQVNYTNNEGRTTQYEMTMTEYEKDKDAEALVIYDVGEYYFQGDENQGMLLHMIRKVKIKILKQAGLKYADFEIPFYLEDYDWETIEDLKGITYNYDNSQLIKTELTNKNIFEEKINENVRVKKVVFPNVREGSVIEFSYKIKTPYFFHMREWAFQWKIPVVHSQLKYRAIPYYDYAYIVKGTNELDELVTSEPLHNEIRFGNLLYKEMEYTFGLKDIPAFRDEQYITSPKDYMIGINFQLAKINHPRGAVTEIMTTWPKMCEDFLKDDSFGKYIKNSEKEAKKILPTLSLDDQTSIRKIELISNYVKSNYNWNGIYGKYAYDKVSDFMKQKTGNVANINLFLIGLLKSANIEVYPVILSTRGNGMVNKNYPFRQFFNYVIAAAVVEGKLIYIDASESLLNFNILPPRCVNVEGLMLNPAATRWLFISQKGMSMTQKKLHIKLDPETKELAVNAKFTGTEFDAYNYRRIYLGKEDNLAKYLKENNSIEVKNGITIEDTGKLDKPFSFSFNFSVPMEGASDKLFIHPLVGIAITENPFKQKGRTLPVDLMFVKGEIYKSEIEIPTGYKVEYLPEKFSINNEILAANCTAENNDGIIEVSAFYTLNKNIYPAEEYEMLKQSYADMIKHFSEMIVLVKE